MNSRWLWIGGGMVVVIVWALMRRRRAPLQFADFVKNPALFDAFVREGRQEDAAAEEVATWSDRKVEKLIRGYVFGTKSSIEAGCERRVLQSLGPRAHATVLAILDDQEQCARLVKPTGKGLLPEAPFNRACDLLGDEPPAAAAQLKSKGVELVEDVHETPWNTREIVFRDDQGHTLYAGEPL